MTFPDPCPEGYFCPEGTGLKLSNPCLAGTYMPRTRSNSILDCVPCDPGMYCGEDGLTLPTGECDGGYYCTGGAYSASPRNDSVSMSSLKHCATPCSIICIQYAGINRKQAHRVCLTQKP